MDQSPAGTRRLSSEVATRIRRGARHGASFAGILLLIGALRFVITLILRWPLPPPTIRDLLTLAIVLSFYVGAFMLAGGVLGWLWPLRRTRPGAFALGYVGAGIVSAIIAVVVGITEGPFDLIGFVIVTGIMTLGFGTLAGFFINRDWR